MKIHNEEASWEIGEDDVYGTISGSWSCDVAAVGGKKGALALPGRGNAPGGRSVMCDAGIIMCAGTVGFNEQFEKQNKTMH